MNNINGNKVDLNSVYRDGMSTVQLSNGATQTMTADGSMVLDSSGSILNCRLVLILAGCLRQV